MVLSHCDRVNDNLVLFRRLPNESLNFLVNVLLPHTFVSAFWAPLQMVLIQTDRMVFIYKAHAIQIFVHVIDSGAAGSNPAKIKAGHCCSKDLSKKRL